MRKLIVLLAVLVVGIVSAQNAQEPQDPKALVKAREAYQKEVRQALVPVNRDYLQMLESLKKDFGTNGDTAGMVAVQREIDTLRQQMESEKPRPMAELEAEKMVIGKWNYRASNGFTTLWTFAADHTEKSGNGATSTWEIKNGEWRTTFSDMVFVAKLPLKQRVDLVVFSLEGAEITRSTLTKQPK